MRMGSTWCLPILHDRCSGPTTWKMTRMRIFPLPSLFASHLGTTFLPIWHLHPALCAR